MISTRSFGDGFETRENDGLRLILPKPGTDGLSNSIWTRDNLDLRSRVEDVNGVPVSVGFKKFWNLGMGPDGLRVEPGELLKAIEDGDAVATLKLDGSLLIRSVFKGKVMWRTRGSFTASHVDNSAEMNLFVEKYPLLFDPDWFDNVSLLFEWTSPSNVIVLKYPEPSLTLIGAIRHDTLTYLPVFPNLEVIAELLQVPLVEYFDLDIEGWDKLQARLKNDSTIEGYVIRIKNEQVLIKVKCEPYLTKHSLKSKLNTESLADMWFQQGQPDFNTFSASFISSFDEETYMWALGAISALFDGIREYSKIIYHMKERAGRKLGLTRKEAALDGLSSYGQTKRFALFMNIWEGAEPKQDLLKSILLQNTKQVEFGMFKPTEEVGF